MKKLLLFSAFIGISLLANAQSTTQSSTPSSTYKAFKVDVDFGYAIPSAGSGTKAGATFTIEPHYRLSDDFAIGLRIEGAALGYETNGAGSKIKVSLLTSYSASGDYYLMEGGFRPFVGAGAGFFNQSSVVGNKDSGGSITTVAGGTNFGFFPRVGFEAGHFRLSAAYNIVGNNSSYAAITVGFFLGGGKK